MNELTIQPFREEHLEAALEIYNHYILETTATFSVETIDISEMRRLAFSGLERFPSYILLEDGEVVGYSLLNRYKPREAYDRTAEVTIYLHKDKQGKGYGRKAAVHIEEVARKYGFRALLAVICEENEKSIRLFRSLGYFECAHFIEVGEKFGRLLDVVILEKLLK